ncbi:MAG TPA: hypothetical protein PKC19_19410 [Roseiflexaceae bacterium]|nr:hypothetical protein [Roseiflexaceae bacterium]
MNPAIRNGLLVGGIGILINAAMSALLGFCGPFVTLIAGGVAGLLTARALAQTPRSPVATQGAVAGALTGGLMLIGQMIGAVGAVMIIQASGSPLLIGDASDIGTPAFRVGAIGIAICFGIVGIIFGALAGAGAAYLAWRNPEPPQYGTPA